jgi:single-strand DNA-binding protein
MLNRVVLVGRLTRDPEMRKTASGLSVVSFSLASNDGRKNADGTENTLFINCSLFGQRAEAFYKYTRKGSLIDVEGKLQQRKYTNKAGAQVTVTEILVDNFDFLDSKNSAPAEDVGYNPQPEPVAQPQPQNQPDSGNLDAIDVVDDDLPF